MHVHIYCYGIVALRLRQEDKLILRQHNVHVGSMGSAQADVPGRALQPVTCAPYMHLTFGPVHLLEDWIWAMQTLKYMLKCLRKVI